MGGAWAIHNHRYNPGLARMYSPRSGFSVRRHRGDAKIGSVNGRGGMDLTLQQRSRVGSQVPPQWRLCAFVDTLMMKTPFGALDWYLFPCFASYSTLA